MLLAQWGNGNFMKNNKEEVSQEFAVIFDKLNTDSTILARLILDIVSKNDVRLLKKVDIRLSDCIKRIREEVK